MREEEETLERLKGYRRALVAVYTLYEGVGSVEAIDTAMKLGANHPMGPLELAD